MILIHSEIPETSAPFGDDSHPIPILRWRNASAPLFCSTKASWGHWASEAKLRATFLRSWSILGLDEEELI